MNKTVAIGVTGSIAAFKVLDLVRSLKREGVDVIVIQTKSAAKIVDPREFEKISGNKTRLELFEKGFDTKNILRERKVDHIEIAKKADVFVVAPATANTISKIAHGIADDFLTTTILATKAPVIICPAMNVNVWHNPVVEENLAKLRQYGHEIVEPAEGMLACGLEGKGRLADIETIKKEISSQLNRTNSLKGKKIIITSGGTSEKIDEVRYVTNRSSGKMGSAIAEECYLRGGEVLILRAKNSTKPRYPIREELFVTTDDLYELVKKNITDADIIFHVAAVSDFKTAERSIGKISSDKPTRLELVPQIKISDQIKKLNPAVKLIAFKAEYGLTEKELIKAAENKLQESQADAIIANDVSRKDSGFEAEFNEVFIVTKPRVPPIKSGFNRGKQKEIHKVNFASKREVAREVVGYLSDSSVL